MNTFTYRAPAVIEATATERRPIDDQRRAHIEYQLAITDCIAEVVGDRVDLSPLDMFECTWHYSEPYDLVSAADDVRRAAALDWLARHAKVVAEVGRRMGHTEPIPKVSTEHHFGVGADIGKGFPRRERIGAYVPARLTCEYVETGEVETIPAQPERTEPVMERRCPPSIFAGIEQEVA